MGQRGKYKRKPALLSEGASTTLPLQNENNKEYDRQIYGIYEKQRNDALQTKVAISERFEKTLLMVSGGALALSMTFLEKIVPLPLDGTKCFLLLSWLALAFAIVSCLLSLFFSQKALDRHIANLDLSILQQQYPDNPKYKDKNVTGNFSSTLVMVLNAISTILVTIGIVLMILFAFFNYLSQANGSKITSAGEQQIITTIELPEQYPKTRKECNE